MSYTYDIVVPSHTAEHEVSVAELLAILAAVRAEFDVERAELRAELAATRAELAAARAETTALQATNTELRTKVERLENQKAQNSTNSHRPPSTDPPGAVRPVKKKPSKRKRGGQPGRKGVTRRLVPVQEVTAVVPCVPEQCRGCGGGLTGTDPRPERHQVTEIPPVVPFVTEYQHHERTCNCCGTRTRGALPAGVTSSQFGPRFQALVAVLSGVYRMSKRNIRQLMADYLGVAISVGSISQLELRTSRALQAPVEEAKRLIQDAPVVHADETGWREANKKAWLWAAVTTVAVVFLVRLSRGAKVAKELLGEGFAGILVSDRWSGYQWVDTLRRQLCWSHLIRDFKKMADSRGPVVPPIGKELGKAAKVLFRLWRKVRDGTLTRTEFQSRVAEQIRPEIERLLAAGAALPQGSDQRGMCEALLEVEAAMWTFVSVEGLEPTNNTAERNVRHAVLWRRMSFGTQSIAGSAYVERIMTTVATLRLQGRHVLDYVTQAWDAANRKRSAPSLFNST